MTNSEPSPAGVIPHPSEAAPEARPSRWWQWVLVYPTLAAALISAVPTWVNLYEAHARGVAPTEVEAANEQNRLWTKNFECTGSAVTEFQHVKNQLNIEVGARVCPSGDVLLLIKPPARDPIYRWVAINKFVQTVGLLGVTAAEADVAHPRYAQGVYVVLSQRWLQQGLLKQRLRYPDGQCFDAVVNTYTGALLSQTPVACDAAF